MDILPINIAFIPPDSIIKSSVELSKKFTKTYDVLFTLDEKNYYTHISIYQAEVLDTPLEKIFSIVNKITKQLKSTRTRYVGINSGDRYIDFTLEKNTSMQLLQDKIVQNINPFRKGYIRKKYKTKKYRANKTKRALQNIKNYGRVYVFDLWRPHITITRFKKEGTAEKVAETLKIPDKKFVLDTIGIFFRGRHGTCSKLLASFPLGN